jgi:hypothetical protein
MLIEIIALMCASQKSRLVSHVNAVYNQALSSKKYHQFLSEKIIDILNIHVETDDFKDIIDCNDKMILNNIKWLLYNSVTDEEKMGTWYWMSMLLNSKNKYKIMRGYPKKRNIISAPIFFVWNLFLSNNNQIITILYKFYLNENENHIYLILALLYWFYKNINNNLIDYNKIISDHGGYNSIIYYSLNDHIEIPQYAVDKHTKIGRIQGKNTKLFAEEGAVIFNKHQEMERWSYLEEIYMIMRGVHKNIISHETESNDDIITGYITEDQLKNIYSFPKGQILTSVWKKYVYIPLNENYVYKGPWNIKTNTSGKEKLRKLKFRFDIVKIFCKHVLTGDIMKDNNGEYWIRYDLISAVNSEKWIIKILIDTIRNENIHVVDRISMGVYQLSYFSDNEDFIYDCLFGKIGLYYEFLLLYLLEVGDTGLYNVIVKDEECYIIDIEDDTTKKEFINYWDIFARKPSNNLVQLISKGIEKNKEKLMEWIKNIEDKIDEIKILSEKYGIQLDIMKKIENLKEILSK